MSEPFLAEIRMVGFAFAPRGWALCDGQILPINQNQSLYSLLGTTYGGDGRTSFALPDLRGRAPVHPTAGINLGSKAGEETHPLSQNEMPAHGHAWRAQSADGDSPVPAGTVPAALNNGYGAAADLVSLVNGTVQNAGGGQAHDTMQPSLAVNFCIALIGLFPSRN